MIFALNICVVCQPWSVKDANEKIEKTRKLITRERNYRYEKSRSKS